MRALLVRFKKKINAYLQIRQKMTRQPWTQQEEILKCGLTSTLVNSGSHFKCK